MNLNKMQYMISEITADLAEFNANPLNIDTVGYFRVVSRSECLKAAADEARDNGSILAFNGEVTCIMPKLIPGWTKYGSAQ